MPARAIVRTSALTSRRHAPGLTDRLAAAALVLARTGDAFLPAVLHYLADALASPLVVVGELEGRVIDTVMAVSADTPERTEGAPGTFTVAGVTPLVAGQLMWLRDGVIDGAGVPSGVCAAFICDGTGGRSSILAVVVDSSAAASDLDVLLPLFAPRVAEALRSGDRERARVLHEERTRHIESIGRLAGGVAHDFNNLLMIMIGYAEMLRDRHGASDEADELLAAGSRASTLIRQLLAYGRRQVLQVERIDVTWVVSRVEEMLSPVLGPRVDMVCTSSDDVPFVNADALQLEQVLVNLALNARDAMPDGGTLTIRTAREHLAHPRQQMPAGRYACVTVADTGLGIPPDVLAHVFEPFYTAKGARGSGLGLSSVYGIVTQSGGYIWCESGADGRSDRGTTFRIYLPAAN